MVDVFALSTPEFAVRKAIECKEESWICKHVACFREPEPSMESILIHAKVVGMFCLIYDLNRINGSLGTYEQSSFPHTYGSYSKSE